MIILCKLKIKNITAEDLTEVDYNYFFHSKGSSSKKIKDEKIIVDAPQKHM